MSKYIVRTDKGDIPVNPRGVFMTEDDLRYRAEKVMRAARSQGLKPRLIHLRTNPAQNVVRAVRMTAPIAALFQDAAGNSTLDIPIQVVASQRLIGGVDLGKTPEDQAAVVIRGEGATDSPDAASLPRLPQGSSQSKVFITFPAPDAAERLTEALKGRKNIVLGIMADVAPSDTVKSFRWVNEVRAALGAAIAAAVPAGPAAPPPPAPPAPTPLRYERPGEDPAMDSIDFMSADPEEVQEYLQSERAAVENEAEAIQARLADLLQEKYGLEFRAVPYSPDRFRLMSEPDADVLVGFFYARGPADERSPDPIEKVMGALRPTPNLLTFYGEDYPKAKFFRGGGTIEGASSIGLIVPPAPMRSPMYWRDVRDNLMRLVDESAAQGGRARGLRVRSVGGDGAEFLAPAGGVLYKFVTRGVATPKVHIAREASGIFVEPYVKHFAELTAVLNQRIANAPTQRRPGGVVDVLEHLDPVIAKLRKRIEGEKARIDELNAMPLGATRDMEIMAQRVEAIQEHIALLSDRENVAFDRFRRLKSEGALDAARREMASVDGYRRRIAELRSEFSRFPRTLSKASGLADRLRALRSIIPPRTPEGYYEGDDRTGVYLVEVYDLPQGHEPLVKAGTHVEAGQPITRSTSVAKTVVATAPSVETALDAGKEGIAPKFAVVSIIQQRVPVTTAPIMSIMSSPIPVPPKGDENFAYQALRDAIAGRPPDVDDEDLVQAAQSVVSRMPRSGEGTPAYDAQVDALAVEAARTYAEIKQRRAFADLVNAVVEPHARPLLAKLEQVYRIEAAGGKKGMEEAYNALLMQYARADLEGLEERIEAAVRSGEARDWATRVATEEAAKVSLKTGTPAEPSEEMIRDLMRKLATKKYTPALTTEPIFYYTLTFTDREGTPMWMGSVPDMRVAPPEDIQLLDKRGRAKYLPPIMSMFPLDPYRVAGMLRRFGGAMNMLFLMSRGGDMEWVDTAGRKSKDMSRAEFLKRAIEMGIDLAAERRLLAGTAKRVVEGEVLIKFSKGDEGGAGFEVRPYQIGGRAPGGAAQIGETRVLQLIGMVAGTEDVAPGVESSPDSRRRFDRLIWQVKRNYIDEETRRLDAARIQGPLLDRINRIRADLGLRPVSEVPKPPKPVTKAQRIETSLITSAGVSASMTTEALEEMAQRIKQGTYNASSGSEEASLIAQLGTMPRSNPMNRLLNNPRYRQLMEKTGRAFGRPIRRNGGPDDDLWGGLEDRDEPPEEPVQPQKPVRAGQEEGRAAGARQASTRRFAAGGRREEEERSAGEPSVQAAPPPPSTQDDLVRQRSALAGRIEAALRSAKAAYGEFYDLLKSPRAGDDAVAAAKGAYEGAYDDLADLRRRRDDLTLAILGPDLGQEQIESEREDEAAMAAEIAASPAMRAPRGENEKFTVSVRSDLVDTLAHDLRPDGVPYYNVDSMLRARGLDGLTLRKPEEIAARRAAEGRYAGGKGPPLAPTRAALPMTLPLSPQQMLSAARSQGRMQRVRPASTASAFERAERARVGKSLSYTQYDAPDRVKLTRSGPGAKSVVLWMSPLGDHVIRFVNMARAGQFHQVSDDGESWVDVLAKALQHQALFLADEQMTATPGNWEIWIGKSGWPHLYRIRSAGEKKPFTVEAAMSRLSALGLSTTATDEALEQLRAAPAKAEREVKTWSEDEAEVRQDALMFQNALAAVFAKAGVAEREGLLRLRRSAEAERMGERRAAAKVEAGEAAPGVFVFVPPRTYDANGNILIENQSNAGTYLYWTLSRSLSLARAAGIPVRLLDANLFGARDSLLQATLDPEKNDKLALQRSPAVSSGEAMPKKDHFPSPLIALLELAAETEGSVTIEIILPASATLYNDKFAALLEQYGDADVNLGAIYSASAEPVAALTAELGGHTNQVLLLNLPDETVMQTVGAKERLQMFGEGDLGGKVIGALANNVGHVAGVVVVTADSSRVENLRRFFAAKLGVILTRKLGQKNGTPDDVPLRGSVDLQTVATELGLDPDAIKITEAQQRRGVTRADVRDAVLAAMAAEHGATDWRSLFGVLDPIGVRANYGRRTRIDMASRYMRQKPWMF
jgi:hypothetical protein